MKLTTLLCFVLVLLTTPAPAADAPLTPAERARDPRFAELADAHHAYRLGAALGSLPMNFISGTPGTDKLVADMKKLAGELGAMRAAGGAGSALALPDPPARSGDPETDYVAIMKYFGACDQQIRKAIGAAKPSPGMPDARACFELGWGAPQWVLAYGAGMEKLRDSFAQNLPGTVQKSGLPAELWQPLIDQAHAKVPRDDFAAAYRKAYESTDSFFRKTGAAHRERRVGLEGSRHALAVGFSLGSVALSFVWEKDAAAARTHFAAAWNGLTWFDGIEGGKMPPLPKLTGKGEADLEAIKRFVKTHHEEMGEDLDPEDDRAFAPYHYFELGYRAVNARLVNRIDSDEQRARFVESLEKQGRFCDLPATAPATLAEAKSAPQGNAFDAVVLKFVREVESYLAAEEKKLTGREPTPVAATATPAKTTPLPQGALTDLREAKQAWLAGVAIGRAAQAFLAEDLKTAEKHRSQAAEALGKWKDVAGDTVRVSLPKVPAQGSRRQADVPLAFGFVQETERALSALGKESGAAAYNPMTWFQMGVRAGLARGLSGARLTVDFNAALDYLAAAALTSEKIDTKWQPFVSTARTGATARERDGALAGFMAHVSQALEAEEKRLAGPVPNQPARQSEVPKQASEANKRRNAPTSPPPPYGQIINPEPSAVIVPSTPPPWLAGKSATEPRQPGGPPIKTGPDGKIITPQAEIDKEGNIIVPGLGMKFTKGGDIIGSKGEKLFDGKTGVWAKDSPSQTAPVPPVQLGETSAQLTARWGKPEIRGSSSVFRQGDWTIGVEFQADRAENVVWRKPLGLAEQFTSEALYAMARDPEPDVQALRRLHAGDKPWAEIGSDVVVIQKGGVVRRIADYKPDAKELADRSLLHLPDITWRSGTLRFNFTVSASDGKLDKSLRITTQDYESRQRAKRPVVREK